MAAGSWKETYFSEAPSWTKAVMAKGFKTPLGCLAMSGDALLQGTQETQDSQSSRKLTARERELPTPLMHCPVKRTTPPQSMSEGPNPCRTVWASFVAFCKEIPEDIALCKQYGRYSSHHWALPLCQCRGVGHCKIPLQAFTSRLQPTKNTYCLNLTWQPVRDVQHEYIDRTAPG